ncbi:unnamed protein product [Aphis gossypii]|uniref:C2H2-type domain-containing protein n=1 Tax=Aphis gossypii TaxID=80765 RepID=A0A9P0J259_APHGO|nr:unnamed protein product [Aphis gossypii]
MIKHNDVHRGKSTKLCGSCRSNIKRWQDLVFNARKCQFVVEFLADKVEESQHNVSKKRKQTQSKTRKRKGSPILEIQFPSISNDLIQSPTESIDSIQQSTSTEIIPFPPASTSTEIIPYVSTSTEIIPSTEDPQLWHTMVNEITGNSFPSEMSTSQAYNAEYAEYSVCVFCIYQYIEISRNMYNKYIKLCPKHSKPYTCLIDDCYTVFPNKGVFMEHYSAHLNIRNTDSLCRKCMLVLTSPSSTTSNHTHQTLSDFFKCCSEKFPTMHKFVVHKLMKHDTFVISAHNRSPISNKLYPFVMSPPKCKIEPIDAKDDVLLTTTVVQNEVNEGGERESSYKCKICSLLCFTLNEYVEHCKRKHNKQLTLKESGIQLCPLCDIDFLCYNFVEHVEKCTNTMKVGDKKLNHFGCVYCKVVFTKVSASIFRKHVLFCRTFKVKCINNIAYKSCINCNFQTTDDNSAVSHANNECIYFQMKMKFAIGPGEKQKVMDRMNLLEEYSKELGNKNCTDNEIILPSTSKVICDSRRRRMLKWYNYYCFNCHNAFFDKHIFYYHLNGPQSVCRPSSLIYCTRCVNDFYCEKDYTLHLPNMPKAAPLVSIKPEIKSEEIDPSYYIEDIIMDSSVVFPNQSDDEDDDIKVFDMNGIRPFQEQTITINDIRSNAQFQEQEVSNYDNTDQEMEFNSNDEYMQCVVEEKPDLNQIMIDNNIQ